MSIQEAKEILALYRPGGADAADPRMAEALALARREPELKAWLAGQTQFDAGIARSLSAIPVPDDLKAAILARWTKPRPAPAPVVSMPGGAWWQPLLRQWRWQAVSAAVVVMAALASAGAFLQPTFTRFTDFRQALIAQSWGRHGHLDFESSELVKVRKWLSEHGCPSDFAIPTEFEGVRLHGARIMDVAGQRVSLVCVGAEGPKHLHLFVMEGIDFPDLPQEGLPDFEKCGLWKTAAWRDGKRIYVLSGMSFHSFVNTFRKSGKWMLGRDA